MFCLKYYPFQNYVNDADELKIEYRPADRTLEDFLEKYHDKSIVIDINKHFEDLDAKLLKGLSDKYKNVKLIVDYNNKKHFKRIQENKIPFFFSNFAKTADEMNGLIKYHPTDMYICEELGFSLDKVSELLHKNDIKVRVFPNICQSSFSETPSIKTFFIRPEDIQVYSTFVDVFEIISDESRQQVLFKIYNQGYWLGNVKDIILSFKDNLDNKHIMSTFAMIRAKCGKRCMYRPESCTICDRFIDVADTLKKGRLIIQRLEKKD